MAIRGGVSIDLCWVHLSLSHPRANDVLDRAALRIAARLPETTLSVNRNLANTEALVKITASGGDFWDSLPVNVQAAIIRLYTEADHGEARALLATAAWLPPPEEL